MLHSGGKLDEANAGKALMHFHNQLREILEW